MLNFLVLNYFSQSDSVFTIDRLTDLNPNQGIIPGISLNHCWKYQKGDNSSWADTNYIDKDWKYLNTVLDLDELPKKTFENCGWFRLRIKVNSQFLNKPLAFMANQLGASEIYLDGKLIIKLGKIDPNDISKDTMITPSYSPRLITFTGGNSHLIAIRYHNRDALSNLNTKLHLNSGFDIKLCDFDTALNYFQNNSFFYKAIMVFYFAFFLALGVLHLLFFSFYPKTKSNLYYSVFALCFGFVFLVQVLLQITDDPDLLKNILSLTPYVPLFYSAALLAMLYTIFYNKILKVLWVWIGLMIVYIISFELKMPIKILSNLLTLFVVVEPLRIIVASIYKKKEGAWIIGSGIITTIAFFTITISLVATGHSDLLFNQSGWTGAIVGIIILISTVSIPLSMSAYLARQFAKTNKHLEKKLAEVEELSAKSIDQEKEKQKILSEQNITLEKQVKERTAEVVNQKRMIEEKQKEMIDSIKYAKRIQQSLLPTQKYLDRILNKRTNKDS